MEDPNSTADGGRRSSEPSGWRSRAAPWGTTPTPPASFTYASTRRLPPHLTQANTSKSNVLRPD